MDLTESTEMREFRLTVKAFLAEHLPPDIRDAVLSYQHLGRDHYVRWQKILAARGWGAPGWPIDQGGAGWNAEQRSIFDDECYKAGAPRQIPFGLSMVGPVLMKFGTPAQRSRFLPRIITMDDWWCQGYSEPGAGSDLASLKTSARRDGDHYVITGQKTWTTLAQYADWMFCLVRTRAEGKPQEGISFVLIDMRSPGVRVRPIRTLDLGADVNEVFLDEVRIPVENRVGEEHRGWGIAKYLLGHERTNIAGIGMCKRLLAGLKEQARRQTKGGRPLLEDGRFRDRVVKLEIDLLSHEWSLMRLISAEQSGRPIGIEASMLKIRGSEIQQELAELLMESAGPYALPFVAEALDPAFPGETAGERVQNGLAALYFDLRKVSIYGGTNEVQRNIIAKSLLGI
ncbi:MAG: acyl-CoA dehydrogenase family protein [Steroidobacteraceae bacterium]